MPRVWFITGCSRGLGKALTEAVLESGDLVIATARKPEQLSHFLEQYGSDRVLNLGLDVSNQSQAADAIAKAHAKFGRIDVVVNNAGYAETSPIEDMSLDSFRDQIEANFLGPVYITKAVLPILRQQQSGHIIQISSVGGRVGSPGLGAYQSAKWAIGGFSSVLSKEIAPFGIKMTVVEPGSIKTDWGSVSMIQPQISQPYEQTVGSFKKMRESRIPTSPEPERFAKAIVHISQEEDPPLRLLLGPDTLAYAKMVADEQVASDEKWKHVTNLEGF